MSRIARIPFFSGRLDDLELAGFHEVTVPDAEEVTDELDPWDQVRVEIDGGRSFEGAAIAIFDNYVWVRPDRGGAPITCSREQVTRRPDQDL